VRDGANVRATGRATEPECKQQCHAVLLATLPPATCLAACNYANNPTASACEWRACVRNRTLSSRLLVFHRHPCNVCLAFGLHFI
jgi:hypothetical protein